MSAQAAKARLLWVVAHDRVLASVPDSGAWRTDVVMWALTAGYSGLMLAPEYRFLKIAIPGRDL